MIVLGEARRSRPGVTRHLLLLATIIVGLGSVSLPKVARSVPVVVSDGSRPRFTASQARAGANFYLEFCASCHGPALQGSVGPGVAGPQFMHRWGCGEEKLTELHFVENSSYFGGSFKFDPVEQSHGWIRAFDALTGKQLWQRSMQLPMVAGLTVTAAGVVFTGTGEGEFLALDVKTGAVLYQFGTGGAIAGAPSTYEVRGKQYLAVPSSGGLARSPWGGHGAAGVFVFALAGE